MTKLVSESLNEFLYNVTPDESTTLFLEGKISFEKWASELDSLNEGKVNDFFHKKIIPALKSIKDKVKKGSTKALKALHKIGQAVKQFAKSNPKLYKFVIVVVLILMISTISAYAAATGDNPSPERLDLLHSMLGYLAREYSSLQSFAGSGSGMDMNPIIIDSKEALGNAINVVKDQINQGPENVDLSGISDSVRNELQNAQKFIMDYLKNKGGFPEELKLLGQKIIG